MRVCEFPGCNTLTDADGFDREYHGAILCDRHFKEITGGGLYPIDPQAWDRVRVWARENMIDGKTKRGEA